MNNMNRLAALLLSILMLVAPAATVAENVAGFSAGDLTRTAISESYVAGMQLNVSTKVDIAFGDAALSDKTEAIASLLEKSTINLSFYDDFGTARIRAEIVTDGVTLFTADALILEDGSAQVMTNLTGKYVLTVPADALGLNAADSMMGIEIASEEFNAMPMSARLKLMASDANSAFLNLLLGWVSATQIDTEELYLFDNEPIEATQTRDAVAQRMVGTIKTCDFMAFLWNVVSAFRDDQGELLQATADILAELGVTRYQARQVIDSLLTEETIDPALDFVQTSWSIQDDGALCELGDVQYFMRKLEKSVDQLWNESTANTMSMIVSYDDNGQMVGFDAEVPLITEGWPYEGDFAYSIKTDEHAQRLHTSHGELQVTQDSRLVGDLNIQFGQDIDGVKQSSFSGSLEQLSQEDGSLKGIDVDAGLIYTVGSGDDGAQTEGFEGSVALSLRENSEDDQQINATITGETALTADTLTIDAQALIEAAGLAELTVQMALEQGEYDEIEFAGGLAVDVTNMSEEEISTIKNEVKMQAAKVSLSLVMHPSVLSDLMTIIGG